MKKHLEFVLVERGLVSSRRQASMAITLGRVKLNGRVILKPDVLVGSYDKIQVVNGEDYVSRAGHKLASVATKLGLNFNNAVVLDVGSSTGGFTDFALQHGAAKVIAVEVGHNQLSSSLQGYSSIELHEQTDIRDLHALSQCPDIVLIDVSFVSLRDILPAVRNLIEPSTIVVAMVKPQFESQAGAKQGGVIKNDRIRREIFKDFEGWVKNLFVIVDKADSDITGVKGNKERFYKLRPKRR